MPIEEQSGEAPLSLRDQLAAAAELHRESAEETSAVAEPIIAPNAERARDEAGKFTKSPETLPTKPAAPTGIDTTIATAPARPAKPSSWRKEFDEHWNTLDPKVADYINQREREYSTGVSTYKAEAERSRAIQGALEPFLPNMQRYNVQPADWIQNVGRTHETLLLGTPQQKLQTIMGLAQAYGVDLSGVLPQGEQQQGQADPNQWASQQLGSMRSELNELKAERQREQQQREYYQQQTINNEIEQFRADTANYPHFETVREQMAGLLQSGLAQDLKSAYDKAIRMHDDLWQSQQDAQRANAEAEQKRQQAEAAKAARAKVASVKSATPSGSATTPKAQGRREQLAEAFASQAGGRV